MKSLLPVLLLGLLTLWSGTLFGGATFSGALTAHAAILGFCLFGADRWRDPLDLGPGGRWLLPALLIAVVASWWLGPVRRAGLVAVLLLPAVALLPAAVERCWRNRRARQVGLIGLCLLFGLVAAIALAQWRLQASPRPAMPLGHHNLLAGWLVIVWPVALLTARRPGVGRALAVVAGALAVGALGASESFAAACGLLLQAVVAAHWWKPTRPWLLAAVLAVWLGPTVVRAGLERVDPEQPTSSQPVAALPAPPPSGVARARAIATGGDSSAKVRLLYARAGWAGLRDRPLLGWGPGSVPWTSAHHLRPVRGVNPPSEIVGDLHSTPVQAGYELGVLGVALAAAIGLLFAGRRFRELRAAPVADPDDVLLLRRGAVVGLIGGAAVLAASAPSHVLALPAAMAVVAGAALPSGPRRRSRGSAATLALVYVLAAALALTPIERAHFQYRQARTEPDPLAAQKHLRRAIRLDPDFPLYLARAAWLTARLDDADPKAADEAQEAARSAVAVAPLWLKAGALGLEAGRPWAEQTLARARELDPLSALPPFLLVKARPDRVDSVELAAAALAAEPRLDAAVFWEEHPGLWSAARRRLGWPAASPPTGTGPRSALALDMDRRSALSFSLYAFRRAPWPTDLVTVELRQNRLTGPR